MFRDDGYLAPKLVVLLVLVVMLAAAVYIFRASRGAAEAGSERPAGAAGSPRIRQIEQAVRDARDAAAGRVPNRWRTR